MKVTHASLVPLVGGMSLGAKEALGSDPIWSSSWSAFSKNESTFHKNFPNVPSKIFESEDAEVSFDDLIKEYGRPNILHCVPPCAGLSLLNNGGSKNSSVARGSNAHQNRWMRYCVENGLSKIKPDVLVFENAPGLMQNLGNEMRQYLKEKASQFGYSMSIIFTDTILHGIPQSRKRTFAFFWKSQHAPEFTYISKNRKSFSEFLKNKNKEKITLEDSIFPCDWKLEEDPFMKFLIYKYKKNWRSELLKKEKNFISVGHFLKEENLLEEVRAWSEKREPKLFKTISHWIKKFSMGKGVWDGSPSLYTDHTNAIISKNVGIIHPNEDRWLSVREMMDMMAFPKDYSLSVENNKIVGSWNIVCQNVPVCTARDMISFARDFVEGNTVSSGKSFILQNNLKRSLEDFR